MKSNPRPSVNPPSGNSGHPLVVAGTSLVLGAALTGAWFHFHQPGNTGGRGAARLSPTTRDILAHLAQPISLRYYSLLPADSAGTDLQAFAGRVDDLLGAMQDASGGKLQLARFDSTDESNANAAASAGIQPFNLDKGAACFLGLNVISGAQKEVLPRLSPEWEPALQYDIDRLLQQIAAVQAPAGPAAVAPPSPEAVKFVKQLIPDVNAISAADADQIFHQQFLNDCAEAGTELEAQINAAQQEVAKAQATGSASDIENARQHLQQVQLAQADKLKQIAANLQLRMAAFQALKSVATNAVK